MVKRPCISDGEADMTWSQKLWLKAFSVLSVRSHATVLTGWGRNGTWSRTGKIGGHSGDFILQLGHRIDQHTTAEYLKEDKQGHRHPGQAAHLLSRQLWGRKLLRLCGAQFSEQWEVLHVDWHSFISTRNTKPSAILWLTWGHLNVKPWHRT